MPDPSFQVPETVPVVCGVCGTRMTPRSKFAGRKVRCPDCETLCLIPTLEQIQQRQCDELLAAPTQPQHQSPYRLQEPVETVRPTFSVFSQLASIRGQEISEPPDSLFFSSVFDFPWRSRGTFVRWTLVSSGFSVVGLLIWLSFFLFHEFGFPGAIAAGSTILGVAVIGLLSTGFAASCSHFILQETAAGVHVLEDWPAEGWRDGIFDAALILWLHATSGFFCYVFGRIVQELTGSLMPPLLALHVLLFPLTLIFSMDSESAWFPYSGIAMRSLKRLARTWFQFYVVSGIFLLVTCGVYTLLAVREPFAACLVLGPFAGTVVFIYSRLVGRMAWKISEDASEQEAGDSEL